MSKRTRRRHPPEQKAVLVRQHMVEKKPVSEICSAAQIQPSVFYKWERDLLAAARAVFAGRRTPSREQELEAKIATLEAKLARKDAIIAEVSEEYVKLKKELGEPDGGLGSPRHARSGGGLRPGAERQDGAWRGRGWSGGWGSPAGSSSTGATGTGKPTSTTRWCPGITGSTRGSARPSSTTSTGTRSRGIAA